ncbi:hypothetical protein GCM10028777_41150 [Angustibacter speluncae]
MAERTEQARREVAAALVDALRDYVVETDAYVDDRGGAVGLHRSDLNALTHVHRAAQSGESLTPGALAQLLRLSPPATSALLGRLEQVGHVHRTHSPTDRRRVQIEMTEQASGVASQVFTPLGIAVGRAMDGYSDEELRLVLRFLLDVTAATHRARTDAD